MSKIIRGTLDKKNRTILKQPDGGVGRIRCPRCQQLAIPEQSSTGEAQYKCLGCGSVLKSQRL